MSQVRTSQRKVSNIQYLYTARELYVHTMQYAKKFPKSAMFFITKDIVDTAREIFTALVKVNSTNDIAFRHRYLLEAQASADCLDGLLSLVKLVFEIDISDYGWRRWGELLIEEKKLIKEVIASNS